MKTVTVGLSRVYNLGNYENVRPEVALTAEVEEGEAWPEVTERLMIETEAFVQAEIDRALEEMGKPPRFYDGPRFALLVAPVERFGVIVPEGAQAGLPGAWPRATAKFGERRLQVVKKLAAESYAGWRIADFSAAADVEGGGAFEGLPVLEWFEVYHEDGFILVTAADMDLPEPWGYGRTETVTCFRETVLARAAALAEETGKVVVDLLDGDLGKLEGLRSGLPIGGLRLGKERMEEGEAVGVGGVEE